MEEVGIFYGNCVYFTDICYILWPFGIFIWLVNWYIFPVLVSMDCREKSGNPDAKYKVWASGFHIEGGLGL
jgi:hypothetical protein